MRAEAAPLVNGVTLPGIARQVRSPIDGGTIGVVREADAVIGDAAIAAAADGFPSWTAWPIDQRAAALERAADRLQSDRGRLLAVLQNEAGKTLDDALAELREAVDYCRYYAAQARTTLKPQAMPGPTGESNELRYRGRGVFVCISPWNFPLAIFVGQIAGLDRDRVGHQSHARRQKRTDCAVRRRDRRHQCHDRRCHRLA